ncbi:hypothetical protein VPNG_08530 [Cytospora leucostoma]|uniref:Uncharacterized protein n=1 Tax=Cytospora leucostoma TaxID=1230097 RepID=A0A423W577_9PEZI|nr:hypothetical protein VPNG_08530 [Cytospora leucostoma]
MADIEETTEPKNGTLLLFGSLTLSFDASKFNLLREVVVEHEDNTWLVDLIRTLPQACETALPQLPSSYQGRGHIIAQQLLDATTALISAGPLDNLIFPLPNTILVPLAVIAQLVQYTEYKQQTSFVGAREALGLCTGLLSAFAVASSHDSHDFRIYGAVAVRLGLLVGLVVDCENQASNSMRSRCLSAAWSSPEKRDEMLSVMKDFSEAYISVHYDKNRATITTSAESISDLTHRLQDAGLSVSEIGLYGRFHSAGNDKSRVTLVDQLIEFCNSPAGATFRLPDAACMATPTRANDSHGSLLKHGALHAYALRSILLEPAQWFETLSAAIQETEANGQQPRIVEFGQERSVPPSLTHRVQLSNNTESNLQSKADRRSDPARPWLNSDIAVVGMSCKVPGADSLEDFWDLLVAGRSQHKEIGSSALAGAQRDRFNFEDTPFRNTKDANMKRKWFANLVDGHDQFDHRFFKKSARESASMDPQQRHILQVAYQAVEQSGYFKHIDAGNNNVGCFVGVCLGDYDNNVASHPANAFTATGNLQGFISGKVSHFFGWTGPGLTINTACSSSLVAVHQACQSILSGECEAALAGGTHIMTSATWFQNLAAGSFLSPTGQCKPFDAKADGYCRGEGVGAVFLKKMSKAVEDGDPVLGVIAGTGVQQNENCTPIFVPNVPSLENLFTRVMAKARIKPSQISVVEAHGTGTAVGDPAEYDSIRKALGGRNRGPGNNLMVSSVKGLVGHMECASGIISLIKILLMLNKGTLPPQASFDTKSPALKTTQADQMFVPTRAQPWIVDGEFRAALINNYGASGSNASAVITQAPSTCSRAAIRLPVGIKHPFWVAGFDNKSLRRWVQALRRWLARSGRDTPLASLSFNLAQQSNRTLDSSLVLTARSVEELDQSLAAFEKDGENAISKTSSSPSKNSATVILCFGGQVSNQIGLDPQIYHGIALMRKHLDYVDAVIQSLGRPSIFPGILERSPSSSIDTVQLQIMLFATQYACARSWIESGVKPTALTGHSFGTLTALCISGILSLEDTVKLIVRRATLVRDAWGTDKGAMMAVEGDLDGVQKLLADANSNHSYKPAAIACYNGPKSFTLAGPAAAIEAVAVKLDTDTSKYRIAKSKKLNVTNAFHSVLVDPLYDALEQSARGLNFRKPVIPIELTTEHSTSAIGPPGQFVADHMRNPVYFHHALKRLVQQHGGSSGQPSSSCIFLEAGTNSTITNMAARALSGVSGKATFSFHGLNVANCDDGWNRLTDTTVSLWKAGLRVQHWAHHGSQRNHQAGLKPLLLPPYQFDPESRHWMDLKVPPKTLPLPVGDGTKQKTSEEKQPEGLLTFIGFQDGVAKSPARFRVNTALEKYKQLLRGHLTLKTAPILSATLQINLVVDAISSIGAEYRTTRRQPQIQDVEYSSPVCFDSARTLWVEVSKASDAPESTEWRFEVLSTAGETQTRMLHTKGKVAFSDSEDPSLKSQLARYDRLFGHGRAVDLLQGGGDVDEVLGNRSIYRIFSEIVDYGDEFRGLQKMACRGNETAGHVVRVNKDPELGFDPHLADTFCQLGGLWTNCMADRDSSHVYLANGIDQWIRLHPNAEGKRPETFDAFAVTHRASDQLSLTDVFVYDAANGTLVEAILGIAYVRIPKASMERLLTRLTEPSWIAGGKTVPLAATPAIQDPAVPVLKEATQVEMINTLSPSASKASNDPQQTIQPGVVPGTKPSQPRDQALDIEDLTVRVKAVIADLSGLDMAEIKDESELADLGIDSLAGMEMVHEIESAMKVKLPEAEILAVADMPGLIQCVAGAMGVASGGVTQTPLHSGRQSHAGTYYPDDDANSDVPIIASSSTSDGSTSLTNTNLSTPSPETLSDVDKDEGGFRLPLAMVMDAFNETKAQTDSQIADMGQASYSAEVLPRQNQLAALLTLEAFETLGAGFRDARPGERLSRIRHTREHERFVTHLYEMLEMKMQIVKIDGKGAVITRTAVALPSKSSKELFEELLASRSDQACADKLTYYVGQNLARVLTGETDGVKVVFGNTEGHALVSQWYTEWPLNRVLIAQIEDFFTRLAAKLQQVTSNAEYENGLSDSNPLRILEMGAGTGGTTKRILPVLARLGLPVEYTFTDLAPSFVATARKRWAKEYPWIKFRVHDIETEPVSELQGTQHFVIASNAVHATKSLCGSTENVRKVLRPNGFLILMEMTRPSYWVDLIFGLFEGWWNFEDGRRHVLAHETRWETDLQAVGYGYVDWTAGERPESEIQKVILAAANIDSRYKQVPTPPSLGHGYRGGRRMEDCEARERIVADYVLGLTEEFNEAMCRTADASLSQPSSLKPASDAKCVLITGATGGLGAHLVAEAALRTDVRRVVCLNRRSRKQDPRDRQMQALRKKGIQLPPNAMAKIDVLETDLANPKNLGLHDEDYQSLLDNVTHIVHNAWLMHSNWPVKRFEPQLRIMAQMLKLACHIQARRPPDSLVSFEFVSSIATVGHHPLWAGTPVVPEERVPVESVLPTGYGEAKYICERMLDATLHQYPERFRATAVRLGQIAGSALNGHWNPMEHISFIIKSSQTLGALPELSGSLGWTSADDMARALVEIVTQPEIVVLHPIYHIDNPVRQPWSETIAILVDAMSTTSRDPVGVIPFEDWVGRVRDWPRREDNTAEGANPGYLLVDFLQSHFIRMSCGGVLMGTAKARQHSNTLAEVGPINENLIRLYIQSWKDHGFLS